MLEQLLKQPGFIYEISGKYYFLGKWICKEPAQIGDETVRLTAYPTLADGRRITRVTRSNSYGLEPNEDGVQDWLMPVTIQYTNEFDM